MIGDHRFDTHEEARSSARNYARQNIGKTVQVYNLLPCDEFVVETKPITHRPLGD